MACASHIGGDSVHASAHLPGARRNSRRAAISCVCLNLLILAALFLLYRVLASVTEYRTLTLTNFPLKQTVAELFPRH